MGDDRPERELIEGSGLPLRDERGRFLRSGNPHGKPRGAITKFSRLREDFLKTYRNTCKLHEVIAGTEMLRHEFLTPDRAVQRTEFSDGTKVVVNFGDKPCPVELDGASYLLPRDGFAVRGPRIEQSLALVDGKPVTALRCGEYRFSDAR